MRDDPLAAPAPLIKRVYAYVSYRIGAGAEAEDVTSETFERALRYRDSFDASRGDATSWLIGIARRCIADAASRRELPARGLDERRVEGPEDDAVRRIDVGFALAGLSGRDRELVALRYGADLTASQIGQLLDMRTNAVEVALHRALAQLRDALGHQAQWSGRAAELNTHPAAD